jgi:uncharacterized protein (TIGR03000 family)
MAEYFLKMRAKRIQIFKYYRDFAVERSSKEGCPNGVWVPGKMPGKFGGFAKPHFCSRIFFERVVAATLFCNNKTETRNGHMPWEFQGDKTMCCKVARSGVILLLTGALVSWTAGSSQAAQRGGGGHGGGGHGGGHSSGHSGGGHGGGFSSHGGGHSATFHSGGHAGNFHGGGRNGFNGGFHHGGSRYWYGHRGFYGGFYGGYPFYGYGYGYPFGYGYYPYSSYYSDYGYSPYSNYNVWPDSGYDSAYPDDYGDAPPLPPNARLENRPMIVKNRAPASAGAHVTVKVPQNAEVWFERTKTTLTGPVRNFQTPPLQPGRHYAYKVRASWQEDGQLVTQTQQVSVSPGADVVVRFFPGQSEKEQPAAVLSGNDK